MKYLLLIFVCLFNITLLGQETNKIRLDEGTILKVKSLSAISSKTASEGDLIEFTVFEDIQVNGKTIIKEGTLVQAYIEDAQKAKGVGKEGTLRIQFNHTKGIDGTKVPLRSTRGTIEGENKAGGAVALAVVVTPLFLLKKGKEAKIPAGKIMEAYVARDVEISVE